MSNDLRHTDLTGRVMFGEDLRGKRLYGSKISLQCATFDGVKLDRQQVALLLLMLSLADIDAEVIQQLQSSAATIVGQEEYAVLQKYLKLA